MGMGFHKGGHCIQQRETSKGYNGRQKETRDPRRQTHHPTKGNKKGYNGRDKGRQNPREGRHTIQHQGKPLKHEEPLTAHAVGNKKGHNGRQGETRPAGRRTHHPTKGNKQETMRDTERQDLREGEHTVQRRETSKDTMGDKSMQTHHPRRDLREGGHTIQE